MFVRYWMTGNVITATPEMTLVAAMDLMHRNHCRRLPVVLGEQLAGIVSLADLYRFLPPGGENKTALPVSVERLLVKTSVGDVMCKDVLTCTPSTTLEEIGMTMCEHKIGALPVVEGKRLIGIITETDYLRAMSTLAHVGEGRRVCFRMVAANKAKTFYEIIAHCQNFNLEVLSLTTYAVDAIHHLVLLRVRGLRVDEFIDSLWKSHNEVLLADQPAQ